MKKDIIITDDTINISLKQYDILDTSINIFELCSDIDKDNIKVSNLNIRNINIIVNKLKDKYDTIIINNIKKNKDNFYKEFLKNITYEKLLNINNFSLLENHIIYEIYSYGRNNKIVQNIRKRNINNNIVDLYNFTDKEFKSINVYNDYNTFVNYKDIVKKLKDKKIIFTFNKRYKILS